MPNESIGTIRIRFDASVSDSPLNSPEYQRQLAEVDAAFKAEGLDVQPRLRFHDAIGGGGIYVGEFILKLAPEIGTILTAVLIAWLKGASGRKVRLKVGDVEAEARTVADIEKLIKQAERLRTSSRKPGELE